MLRRRARGYPWRQPRDIRKVWRKGYWIGKGEYVVRKGETIGPRTMELLALANLASVPVYRKPGARLLSTGNELKKGIVVNSNQYLLTGLLQRDGGEVVGCAIAGDDEREIGEALSHGKDSDLLLVTGGTAKGTKGRDARRISGVPAPYFCWSLSRSYPARLWRLEL